MKSMRLDQQKLQPSESLTPDKPHGVAIIVMVAILAFGPYVAGGLRTEQIALYGAFALLITRAALPKIRPNGHGVAILVLLALELSVGLIGVVDPISNTTPYQFGSTLAGIDNFTLPIVALLVAWMLVGPTGDPHRLLRAICATVVWAMILNSFVEIWTVASPGSLDLTMFHGRETLDLPGAERLAIMGRYCGIFAQPTDAGFMYSIALLCAVYLYRNRAMIFALSATLLGIGGTLTVSKIFLLVGLPIVLWQTFRAPDGRHRRLVLVLCVPMVVWIAAHTGIAPHWAGKDYLLRLMPRNGSNTIELYTAGRLGSSSSLSGAIDAVLAVAPVGGIGVQGISVAYDNGWIEALVISGLIGVAAYTIVLVLLIGAWFRNRSQVSQAASSLAGGVAFISAGASVGTPALTANRCGTIIWLIFGIVLLSRRTLPLFPAQQIGLNGTALKYQYGASHAGNRPRRT